MQSIYLIGREGPSRFLLGRISFCSSSVGSNLARALAGPEIFRNPSLPPSSRLRLGLVGDADLIPPEDVPLECFRRGKPFLMSLSSRSTMHPSCSSSSGRGLVFTLPPASAFLAASSAFFFSRAFRFSSWIRNCSLSWNERKGYKAKYNVFVIVHFSLQIYETAKPVFIHLLSFVQLITKSLEQRQ